MRYAKRTRTGLAQRAIRHATRQRVVAFGMLTTLTGAVAMLPAGAAEAPRTEVPELGGYALEGVAAPFSVLFYETISQLPTDPGESEAEASVAYTQSELSTGPSSRAVASSSWPGGAVGDGFPTICDCDQGYFIKSEAYYPAGPFEEDSQRPAMHTVAQGLDTFAEANEDQSPNQEAAGFGNASSRSATTVLDGIAISTITSEVSDVNFGGVIRIKSVKTVLTAISDGVTATTSGQTSVSGVEIAGQAYVVDEDGLHPEGEAGVALPANGFSNAEGMGIKMFVAEHEESIDGAVGSREAGGLLIEIDFPSFFEGMPAEISGPVSDAVVGTIGEIPQDDIRNNALSLAFASLTTGPKVRYVLARGEVYSASNSPFEFKFTLPPVGTPPTFDAPSSGNGGFVPPPAFETGTTFVPNDEQPNIAPPEQTIVAGVFDSPPWFEGWYPLLIALGLGITAFGAWGLDRMTGLAFGATAAGACSAGSPTQAPNLRRR